MKHGMISSISNTITGWAFPERGPKHALVLLWLVLSTLLATQLQAQIQRFPASLTTGLTPPYSLYLDDIVEPGSDALVANIVFNDFDEPSWRFRLRLTIESQDIRLQTRPGFIPSGPITAFPGELVQFTATDWSEYFNYNNLIIEGPGVDEFYEKGRLPEGFYRFCLEVLDYETGEPLSRTSCAEAWLRLKDPPRLNSPACGSFVDPRQVQFNFIWQLFNSQSIESQLGTTFELTIWEQLDMQADPLSAVPNGQALQVYQSGILSASTFPYGLTEPLLERGKRYIYQVRALDADGRDTYKNQGFSEFCNFFYGWPEGGNVELLFPEEDGGFRKRDMPWAKWKTVDNMITNQQVSYHITVAPINEGQSREDALFENEPFYYYESLPTSLVYEPQLRFNKQLKAVQDYVWQVKAYSDEQEVGTSGIALFHGPSLVEEFFAGTHLVKVDYLDGTDLNNLTGEGSVRLSQDYDLWTDIEFSNIALELVNGLYVMTGGEIYHTPESPNSVTITADLTENLDADFAIEQYRLDKEGLDVFGHVAWGLPHAVLSPDKAVVQSKSEWANFDGFSVSHAFFLREGNNFTLLDPFGFEMELDTASVFYVYENSFDLKMKGRVVMPELVKGKLGNEQVSFSFHDASQLFYITVEDGHQFNQVAPLNRASLYLDATTYTIDLSETTSPSKLATNLRWKGIYFDTYDLLWEQNLDQQAQISADPQTFAQTQSSSADRDAWITHKGVTLQIEERPAEGLPMVFQTFPASLRYLRLDIAESTVGKNSILKGDFILPVVSAEQRFNFETVIAQDGFREGYLTNLEGHSFAFNPEGGDQRINIRIKRAVLAGNEKIVMTLDIDWPGLNVNLTGLRAFSAWGDYHIGFGFKNGTLALEERVNARMGDYPITLAVIGAGASEGTYAFATKTDIQLGDDVSGNGKAPEANIFSAITSPFAPEGEPAVPDGASQTDQISFDEASENIEQDYAALADQIEQQVAALQGLENGSAEVTASYTANVAGAINYDSLAAATLAPQDPNAPGGEASPEYNDEQNELLHDLIAGFVDESLKLLAQPITDKIDSVQFIAFKKLDSLQGKVLSWADEPINQTVDFIAQGIVNGILNNKGDLAGLLNTYSGQVKDALKTELRVALNKSVNDNLKVPIRKLLQESLKQRLLNHFSAIVYEAIATKVMGRQMSVAAEGPPLEELITDLPEVFEDVFKDFKAFLEPDSLFRTVQALGVDFIENIDTDRLVDDLKDRAVDIAADYLQDQAAEAVSELAADFAAESGLTVFGGGGENPLNFVGIGSRIANGVSVEKAFFIEPVWVNLNTPVLALNGPIQYIPEHPEFGDVWSGDIELKIKVPKEVEFRAIYINGKKGDLSYWFAQIDPVEDRDNDKKRQAYKVGQPLPKGAREMKKPVGMGVLNLVAASGRVYRRMSEQAGGYIRPDAQMNYGAFFNLVFYDPAKANPGAKMRLEVKGEINSKSNGDYTIDFEGNLQLQSETHTVLDPDPHAVITGITTIHYNSAEKHFIGYAKVVLFKPNTLCAEGSLLVDVKPGKWRVAIGSREERLQFVPGCVGWSPTGWLDINQNEAELGLGLQLSAKARTPKIPIPPFSVRVTAEAGLAFGIMAAIQYRPSFLLLRAGVWAEVWAWVDVEWKPIWKRKWKRKRLIDIYLSGDLTFYFVPKPTKMVGKMRGHVRVAGIGIKFKANVEKEL